MGSTAMASPYYMAQPAGGALTPYDIQPVYSLEGIYSFADDGPDTYGARLNLSLYSDAVSTVRHQFSISAGYSYGSESGYIDTYGYDLDITHMPITIGYDLNFELTDHMMIDLGAKVGYAFGKMTLDSYSPVEGIGGTVTEHMGGFTYALTAGIKVQFSETIYAKVAYEFGRTFYEGCGDASLNYNQHSIVVGVGMRF